MKKLSLLSLLPILTWTGIAHCQLSEAPAKVVLSQQFIKDAMKSPGRQALQVFDNMAIDNFIVEDAESNDKYQIKDIKLSSAKDFVESKMDDLKLNIDFDKEKNQVQIGFKDSSPLISGRAVMKTEDGEEVPIQIMANISEAAVTFDLQYYKDIVIKEPLKLMKKMNVNITNEKHLAVQIVSNLVNVVEDSIQIKVNETATTGSHVVEKLQGQKESMIKIREMISQGVKDAVQKRINIINDPEEILSEFDQKKMSVNQAELAVMTIMKKLGFQLPMKLMAPATIFAMSNVFGSKIQIEDESIRIHFDPTHFVMSEEVQKQLMQIEHPPITVGTKETDQSYSVTLDQNLMNSIVGHFSLIKQEFSLRKLIQMFDQKGQFIGLMHTKFMKLNMPKLYQDYGDRFFDIVITVDHSLFEQMYSGAHASGLEIDDQGNLSYTQNFVSFLKVSPAGMKKPGSIEDVEDDEEDLSDEEIEQKHKRTLKDFSRSQNWEVARTIYTSVTMKGQVEAKYVDSMSEDGKKDSLVKARIESFELSKMDFYLGDQSDPNSSYSPQKVSDDDFDEDEEEDDDDDDEGEKKSAVQVKSQGNNQKSKTSEGGLIQGLVNIQLKHYLQKFFPKINQRFANQNTQKQVFNCYGIFLDPPELNYFKGGFQFQGRYQEVPQDLEMCRQIVTNPIDFTINNLIPDEFQDQFKTIQTFMKFMEGGHINLDELMVLVKSRQFGTLTKNFETFLNTASVLTAGDKEKQKQVKAFRQMVNTINIFLDGDQQDLRKFLDFGTKVFNPVGRKEIGMFVNKQMNAYYEEALKNKTRRELMEFMTANQTIPQDLFDKKLLENQEKFMESKTQNNESAFKSAYSKYIKEIEADLKFPPKYKKVKSEQEIEVLETKSTDQNEQKKEEVTIDEVQEEEQEFHDDL